MIDFLILKFPVPVSDSQNKNYERANGPVAHPANCRSFKIDCRTNLIASLDSLYMVSQQLSIQPKCQVSSQVKSSNLIATLDSLHNYGLLSAVNAIQGPNMHRFH